MRRRSLLGVALAAVLPSALARAHTMPNSTVTVEVQPQSVRVVAGIPLSELAAALSGTSDTTREMWREVQAYLAQHVAVLGADGRAWSLGLRDEDVAAADGDHPAIMVVLTFTPPVGGSARAATLRYDAVTHRVASQYVLVYRHVDGERIPLGRLQSPATDLPLPD